MPIERESPITKSSMKNHQSRTREKENESPERSTQQQLNNNDCNLTSTTNSANSYNSRTNSKCCSVNENESSKSFNISNIKLTNKSKLNKHCHGFNTAIFLNECLITPKKGKTFADQYNNNLPYKSPNQVPNVSHLLQKIQDSNKSKLSDWSNGTKGSTINNRASFKKTQRPIDEEKEQDVSIKSEDEEEEFNVIIDLSRKLTIEDYNEEDVPESKKCN